MTSRLMSHHLAKVLEKTVTAARVQDLMTTRRPIALIKVHTVNMIEV